MAEQKTSCFFKSSWAECSRDKESDIIKLASERAELLLEECARMVTNHMPKVEAAQAGTTESTAVIRLLIKHAGGLERLTEDDIIKQARARNCMVCRKLKSITDLDPDNFWKVFWDIIRCEHHQLCSPSDLSNSYIRFISSLEDRYCTLRYQPD